jgi:hypothetical protein
MSAGPALTFRAVLLRKDPRLPVYIVVPHAVVAPWQLQATNVVEGSVNGCAMGRRTIKRWDASPGSPWFVEFTAPFCQAAGIAVGDGLDVSLVLAATDMPDELRAQLTGHAVAMAAWDRLSESKRRTAMEFVRSGKTANTRERRAASMAERLSGTTG